MLGDSILQHPQLPQDILNRHDANILRQHLVPHFRALCLFLDTKDFLGGNPLPTMGTYTCIKSGLKIAQIWLLKTCMSRGFIVAKKKKRKRRFYKL